MEITDAPLPRQANEPPGDSGGSLYAPHVKIYPKRAHGRFRTAKWIVMAVTLGIYYLVPWIRWDRGSYLPDQAVLIDFPARRFYFFFLEIWPQEFYYITGLLVLASLALFLVTSVAGRVWCGYTCPQTVWTDLMIAVERFFQGDRNQRLDYQEDQDEIIEEYGDRLDELAEGEDPTTLTGERADALRKLQAEEIAVALADLDCQMKHTDAITRKVEIEVFGQPVSG